ncbi:hypothetical protein SPRG_01837 [Saprolegnia parasitica CBS 223.65]|uniref:Uncharacterized protein n=1 Tax=Saprolegnia parasitica (strain CBS 223.65) TaxID=695850 RepID=A0A067D2M9_SAPPC|nr:hypothetical protein SPRG_01837 [Saprolegnia parasitica CBS 223.65]KDO33021.1 hypothetical protein SPRG_01837 [Saprolegnia parasitica CBS 223.65]|eukprot:XP_012195793.1 hypothetical protein SPRG_01837 [Saprolegnia parasitica CBS 223.65]
MRRIGTARPVVRNVTVQHAERRDSLASIQSTSSNGTSLAPSSPTHFCYATSWVVGGLVCLLNGVAFPRPSLGGISGAGVARSWGTKVQASCEATFSSRAFTWLNEDYYSVASVLVESASVIIIVLLGVPVGTRFVNIMTTAKVLLVLFILCASVSVFTISNATPFLPPRNASIYGPQGLVVGVTQAFFGYIGFDEVCCLAAGMQSCADVVDFAFLAQIDGLLPPIFARVDGDGRLRDGTLLTGGVCTLLAFCVLGCLWMLVGAGIYFAHGARYSVHRQTQSRLTTNHKD